MDIHSFLFGGGKMGWNRKWLLLLASALIFSGAAAQAEPEISVEYVQREYANIFSVEVNEYKDTSGGVHLGIGRRVDSLPETHPLAPFVNDNYFLLTYLVEHGTAVMYDEISQEYKKNPKGIKEYFHKRLAEDTLFNSHILAMLDLWLQSQKRKLAGFAPAGQKRVKKNWPEVKTVAVRFFYPDKITEWGIQCHICVGINGVAKLPDRNPFVEAFVFSAIVGNLFSVWGDMNAALKTIKPAIKPIPPNVQVDSAQTMMWRMMYGSKQLEKALKDEYERTKIFLPFEIAGS